MVDGRMGGNDDEGWEQGFKSGRRQAVEAALYEVATLPILLALTAQFYGL